MSAKKVMGELYQAGEDSGKTSEAIKKAKTELATKQMWSIEEDQGKDTGLLQFLQTQCQNRRGWHSCFCFFFFL